MAGAGYKLFTTGDVLTAAQVNTYLQEQTVMSFADSAARTSALSGVLAEGMMSYLRDTNAVQVYNGTSWVAVGSSSPLTTKGDLYGFSTLDARIPIGTNNQVLTADSAEALGLKWATASATKSFSLLNSGGTALTGAATVTVSSIGGYDQYYVLISGASSSTYANIYLRLNTDTGNNYNLFGYVINVDTTFAAGMFEPVNLTSQSKYRLACLGNDGTGTVSGGFTIAGANTSGLKMITANGGGTAPGYVGQSLASTVGYYNSSTVITSISAFSDIGNFDAGTMFIYGAV